MAFDKKRLLRMMTLKYALYISAALLALSIASNSGIRQLISMKWDIYKSKKDINVLKENNLALQTKILELRNNPRLIEIYARSKLGMVHDDEIVYEIK